MDQAARIRALIQAVDRFHGTEVKDRSQASINEEIELIREWLQSPEGQKEGE